MSKKLLGSMELNRIYQIDCIEGMKFIPEKSVKLVIADPPYNIDIAEWDTWDNAKNYLEWCKKWVSEIARVMSDDACGFVWCSQTFMADIEMILREHFVIQNRIIWSYDNGQRMATKKLSMGYEPLFCFSKGKNFTFNLDEMRDGVIWEGKRTKKHKNGHVTVTTPHPLGRRPLDVWNVARLTGGAKNGHPSPKPEKLVDRLIRGYSNEEDIVLDPFMGSGTTAIMAKHNKRYFIGFEKEHKYIELANQRLESTYNEKGDIEIIQKEN
ncbi:DNA-methyltransferase [Paenibacillus tianjinensis]|uniref:Methyltransferase n=1 Tax=Paenibacillus tianjinensis TaxID=2810347 RepID=A0ABX7L9P5_9BACL|nr:site-specific DNA-methyltransferase [Paenibacillus tianjinensis]QSF43453.1 site-specific DNA-methyltransferase [Paenibacillus tianjinensis]